MAEAHFNESTSPLFEEATPHAVIKKLVNWLMSGSNIGHIVTAEYEEADSQQHVTASSLALFPQTLPSDQRQHLEGVNRRYHYVYLGYGNELAQRRLGMIVSNTAVIRSDTHDIRTLDETRTIRHYSASCAKWSSMVMRQEFSSYANLEEDPPAETIKPQLPASLADLSHLTDITYTFYKDVQTIAESTPVTARFMPTLPIMKMIARLH